MSTAVAPQPAGSPSHPHGERQDNLPTGSSSRMGRAADLGSIALTGFPVMAMDPRQLKPKDWSNPQSG